MVAFVILMVGMMALLSATTTAVELNFDNMLKDEAVQIADERMRVLKANKAATFSSPFLNVSTTVTRKSKLRGKGTDYTATFTSSTAGGNSKLLTVLVSWQFKGLDKRHEFSTLKTY